MNDVTRILEAVEAGDQEAGERLLSLAYEELRRLAAHQMASEAAGHTLQPTALVHEAYLRLAGPDGAMDGWKSRGHFFTSAARAMRRILIESARRKAAAKRGAGAAHTAFEDSKIQFAIPEDHLLDVEEALQRLEAEDPDLARIVMLRYHVGLSVPEVAAALGVSSRTVDRQWRCARAWLQSELSASDS